MGTRGFVGFVIDGTEKIAYSHWDSYPSALGIKVLSWLRDELLAVDDKTIALDIASQAVRAIRLVSENDQPTDEDIERLRPFTDTSVGAKKDRPDWYQLLRETQGNPRLMLAAGVIEDAADFPADSLFAEWGYVVDLDARTFEVYRGFQHGAHDRGRFASRKGRDGYSPVALVATWPLGSLPDDAAFMAASDPEDEV